MAAPMENLPGELKVKTVDTIPDELDLSSPNLNPLRVLYAENVYLPHTNPITFNNLAEFESVVIRGNVPGRGGRGRGRIRRSNQTRSRLATLKTDVKSEDADASEIDEDKARLLARRKKLNRNVLTRMTSYEKGPMTLLKKAVEEQIRVKVWTRSAVTRRGYCIAYIIAFDKHFNLALMDVDETYRIPKAVRKPIQEEKIQQKEREENKELRGTLDSELQPGKSVGTDKLSLEQLDSDILTESKSDDDGSVIKMTERLSIKHQGESESSFKYSSEEVTLINTDSDNTEQIHLETKDSKVTSEENNIKSEQESHDTSSKEETSAEKECLEDKKFITEIQYKTKHRHVNQLFVRGDNVVSVVLLD